ncbi:MAG: methyltransferase domain-containing protein [Candidatus Acidiferrum sp.]
MNWTQAAKRSTSVRYETLGDPERFGFPIELLGLILCPRDSGRLALLETGCPSFVREGWVQCASCRATYEIREGILRLFPAQEAIDPLVKTEQEARDEGAIRYDDRFRPWENAVELSALRAASNLSHRGVMLDLACGTGRLTIPLAALASATIAADLSEASLRVLAGKLRSNSKVALVWSDATQLRLARGSIDFALATQFIEHIPDRAKRLRFFSGIRSALRDGGEFVLSAYYYSALRALLGRKREGFHANGIYYHRFTSSEIRTEMDGLFDVLWTRPTQIDPRLLPASSRATIWLARVFEKMRIPFWIGQLLLVKARKRSGPAVSSGNSVEERPRVATKASEP